MSTIKELFEAVQTRGNALIEEMNQVRNHAAKLEQELYRLEGEARAYVALDPSLAQQDAPAPTEESASEPVAVHAELMPAADHVF